MKTEKEIKERIQELIRALGDATPPFVGSKCQAIEYEIELLRWVLGIRG